MNPQAQDEPINSSLPTNDSSAVSQPMPQGNPSTGAVPPGQSGGSNQIDRAFKEVALPSAAEDTDLIEKEWVERAKEIVEHTREDPYEQQRALSQMKADYLKKRYNKDIKVSED